MNKWRAKLALLRLNRAKEKSIEGLSFWEKHGFWLMTLVVGAVTLDSINLFYLFDTFITEGLMFLMTMTIGFSCIIDIIPIVLSHMLQTEADTSYKQVRRMEMYGLAGSFLLACGLLLVIRVGGSDIMFDGDVSAVIRWAFSLLFGFEPAFTGIMIFGASFHWNKKAYRQLIETKRRGIVQKVRWMIAGQENNVSQFPKKEDTQDKKSKVVGRIGDE